MNPQELRAKAKLIKDMSKDDLANFQDEVTRSTVDDKARYFLYDEIDKRSLVLNIATIEVEGSELRMGEVG